MYRMMHRESQERSRMGFGDSRELEETVRRGSAPYGDMTEQRFGEMKFRTGGLGMSIQEIGVRRIGCKNIEQWQKSVKIRQGTKAQEVETPATGMANNKC